MKRALLLAVGVLSLASSVLVGTVGAASSSSSDVRATRVSPALTVSNVRTRGFTVKWRAVRNASTYQVWIEPGHKASGGLSSTARSYTAVGLTANTRYTVKLDARVGQTWSTVRTTTKRTPTKPATKQATKRTTTKPTTTKATTTKASSDPWAYTVAPPASGAPVISNMGGLGLNVMTKQDISDKIIDGTGDSGVLFQIAADGSTLSRVKMTNVAAGDTVSYGKHGIYAKGRNLTMQDIDVSCSRYCGSGVSLRHDGALLDRFRITGAGTPISYFETTGSVPGTVTVENGSATFPGDTAVWISLDDAPMVHEHFVFKNVSFTGNGAFLKVDLPHFGSDSTVLVEHCFLNGHPVTAADLPNVPRVTILP
jgi:hypothetical protein